MLGGGSVACWVSSDRRPFSSIVQDSKKASNNSDDSATSEGSLCILLLRQEVLSD